MSLSSSLSDHYRYNDFVMGQESEVDKLKSRRNLDYLVREKNFITEENRRRYLV